MNDRALRVLEQYDLEVISTRRGRGSYLLDTPDGLRILADYTGSENKALFQNRVMKQIRDGGYQRVDVILPNREGALVSRDWEENKYVVKEWYPGRECDTSSESEILAAVTNLARLHRLMHVEGEEAFEKSFTAQPPLSELHAKNVELKKIYSFIRKRKTKGEFERMFLNCFSVYSEQALEAEHLLHDRFQETSAGRGGLQGSVCHGDYDHHHVLLSGSELATTNFECCRFDYQVGDLYRFMRKILEKHDWNVRLGLRILEGYERIRPLNEEERQLLYVRMLYPEKFRKLANHYYGGNKAWISRRYLDKLQLIERQREKQEKFVKMLENQFHFGAD